MSAVPPPDGELSPSKTPAPDLRGRAPRPPVVRLRRSVVQIVVASACVLLAGSLAWAFVVQPELRDVARNRAAEARQDEGRGPVRPAEIVTDQPATYDRLPEPRTAAAGLEPAAPETAPSPRSSVSTRTSRPGSDSAGRPSAHQQAIRSALFFAESGAGGGATRPIPVLDPTDREMAPLRDPDIQGTGTVYNGNRLTAPRSPYEIKAGAILPAVLLTGVDTSRPGPVVAAVTQNIYDTVSGAHLLLPQGTRLIGRHEGDSAYGDRRAFLSWERLILPNGKSLVLEAEPGVDAQGATGVRGRVERRIGALVTSTLFAGAITTLGQAARDDRGRGGTEGGSLLGDAGDAAAIEGARVGGRLIDRELEVRPAIRVDAGGLVRVLITRDLVLEPYAP